MDQFINTVERLALKVSRSISLLAGLVLLWIVAITCVDVVGRYFFNSPLYAGAEIIKVSMAGVIFLSLPYMFFKNEHIIVDLFPIFKRGYLGWILGLIFLVIGGYALWVIGDKTFSLAMRSLEDGDTYEYILAPSFLARANSEFLPKVYVDTFIAISIYFTVFMIALRFLLVLLKPGSSAESSEEENL
jgi:TRAP-type C4-dicarboxylate transport system permease small subunit